MARTGKFVPGLVAELFPGRTMPELTADERRHFHREYQKRNAGRRKELYQKNRDKHLALKRKRLENMTPDQLEAHRDKRREYEKNWKDRNRHMLPYYYKRYRLKVEFGLTMERFAEMLREQKGLCALCGRPDGGRKMWKGLVVDHCHASGRVRALLCHQCNMVLGHASDNPQLLRKMADYLEAHAERKP